MHYHKPLSKLFLNTYLLVLTFALCTLNQEVTAQVYKKVDEKGNVIFTDQPDPDAKRVEVRDPNRSLPIDPGSPRVVDLPTQKVEFYKSLEITSPVHETIIPNGLVPFTISANIQPELIEGHMLQLWVDGKLHSEGITDSFPIQSMYRGSRKLQVRIVNNDKETIKQSPTVTIQVYTPKKR